MEFEADAAAPILRYDVPSPSSYEGRNYLEIDLDTTFFSAAASEIPDKDILLQTFLDENRNEIIEYLINMPKEEWEGFKQEFFPRYSNCASRKFRSHNNDGKRTFRFSGAFFDSNCCNCGRYW